MRYLLKISFVLGLFTSSLTAFASNSFLDIQEGSLYYDPERYEAISYAEEQGWVSGYEDGTFQPNKSLNRAEATKVIVKSLYTDEEIARCNLESLDFTDLKEDVWYAPYVCIAKQQGLVEGYGSLFKPSQAATYPEIAKMLSLGYKLKTADEADDWFDPYMTALSEEKLIPFSFRNSIFEETNQLSRVTLVETLYYLDTKSRPISYAQYFDKDYRWPEYSQIQSNEIENQGISHHEDETFSFSYPSRIKIVNAPHLQYLQMQSAWSVIFNNLNFIFIFEKDRDYQQIFVNDYKSQNQWYFKIAGEIYLEDFTYIAKSLKYKSDPSLD